MDTHPALGPLSTLLGTPDPEPRARALLARYPASRLARLEVAAIVATGLVSEREAARIGAAFSLSCEALVPAASTPIFEPWAAAASVPELRYAPLEEMWLVVLDASRRPLVRTRVAKGRRNRCDVDIGELMSIVLRVNGAGFYALHNHPSGDPTPSAEDICFTDQLLTACSLLNVTLHDHVVVAGDLWMSCLERPGGGRRRGSVSDPDRQRDVALGAPERRHRNPAERRLHARLERWAAAHLGADGDACEVPRCNSEADLGPGK